MPNVIPISDVSNYTDVPKEVAAVIANLKKAEERAEKEGWIDDDEIQKVMDLDD